MLKIKEMIKKSSAKYGFNTYDIIYISVAVLISFLLLISAKYYLKNSRWKAARNPPRPAPMAPIVVC